VDGLDMEGRADLPSALALDQEQRENDHPAL